jgi:hypothetical protein
MARHGAIAISQSRAIAGASLASLESGKFRRDERNFPQKVASKLVRPLRLYPKPQVAARVSSFERKF